MEDGLHSSMEGSVAVGENEQIDVKCYRRQLLYTKCNISFCEIQGPIRPLFIPISLGSILLCYHLRQERLLSNQNE